MASLWRPSDTRRHRAPTAPGSSQPPFSRDMAVPPSLIPGHRNRQSTSFTGTGTGSAGGLSLPSPGTNHHSMRRASASVVPVRDYTMSPSPYQDLQPSPPLPLPPPRQQQPVVPHRPPKTPIMILSPSMPPMLPPKPPRLMSRRPAPLSPKLTPRSKSQPPPPSPRGPSPLNTPPLPPLPPMLPPKPLAAHSSSFSAPGYFPSPHISPREKRPLDIGAAPLFLPPPIPPAIPEKPFAMDEEQELELALELSARAEREYAESRISQDEALARALEESLLDSEPRQGRPTPQPSQKRKPVPLLDSWGAHPYSPKQDSHFLFPDSSATLISDAQLQGDEALARRLEAAHESGGSTPTTQSNDNSDSIRSGLPRYSDIIGKDRALQGPKSDATASVSRVSPTPVQVPSTPDQTNTPPRQTPSPAQRTSPRPEPLARPASPAEEEQSPETSPSSQHRAFLTPNQFVEPELLYGVSLGFNTPPMNISMMQGPLPNVIALPYGKCPPMHIHARSWRQLLKLMAKLSGTQIEPSIETTAATKGELKLRTVVQFFKVHHASPDWRTVIYLTVDHPPPPDYRSTNGDVNVLPYSYSLSSLPTLLRDGPESQVSKYYTIPATPKTPLPKLPITMPSMAMYLASALEDSRRALGDTSSGLRRLAKMVDQFYPSVRGSVEVEAGDEEVGRRRGRALIGRLMGRTPRPVRGRNADVYELVTPFVPDEWG